MQPDMIRARDVIPDGILSLQQMIREMQRFLTESKKNGIEKTGCMRLVKKLRCPFFFCL